MAWRLDLAIHQASWDSGVGAARSGGRWNSTGVRAVYCSLDPATAIVEVAVHLGFDDLDRVPRVLTSLMILEPEAIRVVHPAEIPNPNWLRPGRPSANQQKFGDALLAGDGIFAVPSAVSSRSWNLVFTASIAPKVYRLREQERFALDPRLAS